MIHPACTQMLAEARTAELLESAARARAGHALLEELAMTAAAGPVAVMIRFAGAQDEGELAKLAQLDSASAPPLPALVAEVDGELRAALSLLDDRLIADPFHPTLALAELLRTRARQLGERQSAGLLTALRHPLRTARAIRGAVAASA